MVIEDYVSFETAKLLKEKGFDEATIGYYPIIGKAKETFHKGAAYRWNYFSDRGIAAPTLQMAMKWLRKEHNLYIDPYPEDNCTWCLIIWELYPEHVKDCGGKYDDCSYSTYEEACEAAIKYCLEKLI